MKVITTDYISLILPISSIQPLRQFLLICPTMRLTSYMLPRRTSLRLAFEISVVSTMSSRQ